MRAILRALAFSALLVLAILGGLSLGRSAEVPQSAPDPQSAPGTEPASGPPPASLAALRDAGAALAPLGRAGVLDGWLVRKADGSVLTVYAAPGGHVVAGLLYGPDGLELTGGQLERAASPTWAASPTRTAGPTRTASPARAASPARTASSTGAALPRNAPLAATGAAVLADTVRAAAGEAPEPRHSVPGGPARPAGEAALFERGLAVAAFTVGESGPDVVAFVDPGCPWSRRAAAELGGLALEGAFRLHAVPVGVMGPDSHAHAAGILASPRPGLAWYRSEPAAATAGDVARLEANNALWRAFGADAVPWLAWRGRDGGIRTHAGLPASADFMGAEGLG